MHNIFYKRTCIPLKRNGIVHFLETEKNLNVCMVLFKVWKICSVVPPCSQGRLEIIELLIMGSACDK